MTDLISVSDNAVSQIKKILSDSNYEFDSILIGIDKAGCSGYSYKIDYAKSIDLANFEMIEKDNVKIFIDPKATMYLIGSEMDYSSDKVSSRFVFNNPNARGTCGCGESFNI